MAERGKVLALYKRILTLHKQKLEPRMRILGDQYVRDEFKRHKDAPAKFVPMFMREWEQYEALLSQRQDQFGKDLSTEEKALLDAEQKERLKSLKDAAKLVGETIA